MNKPTLVDDLFLIAILLLFLLINYNMPLSQIYTSMTYLVIFMYVTPIFANLFSWPVMSHNYTKSLLVGVGLAVGFIFFYTYLGTLNPMSSIFTTSTAFGESTGISNFVFGVLIPIIESSFFFIVLPFWFMWKINWSWTNLTLISLVTLVIIFGGTFMVFHVTAKGIDNNKELFATFVFGGLSILAVIFTREILATLVLHIVINSYSLGLFDLIMKGSSTFTLLGIGIAAYFIAKSQGWKAPF